PCARRQPGAGRVFPRAAVALHLGLGAVLRRRPRRRACCRAHQGTHRCGAGRQCHRQRSRDRVIDMNFLLPPTEVEHLLDLGGAAMPREVTLGMPHLAMGGLSETWLLKECGHRHWSMLARAAGLAVPEFRDPAGDPIYAAFLAVTVRDAAFETAREHDRLAFA